MNYMVISYPNLETLTAFFKIVLYTGSFYLILQRFHLRLQIRFLKNISDEIIKINDYCIEFSFKYKQHLDDNSDGVDVKLFTEIETIRSKVHNHLDYLSAQIDAFPFGNPFNFLWYTLSGNYLFKKTQVLADKYLTTYQDTILQDTILQKDLDIEKKQKNKENINLIDQNKIDAIVVAGLDIINHLEDHSKKMF